MCRRAGERNLAKKGWLRVRRVLDGVVIEILESVGGGMRKGRDR